METREYYIYQQIPSGGISYELLYESVFKTFYE